MISRAMLDRLIASDAAYVTDRLGVIAARPGNPFGAAIRRDGAVHAFRCAAIQTPGFNRVIGLSDPLSDRVADMTAWLRAAGPRGRVAILPYRHGPALARAGTAVLRAAEGIACRADAATHPLWRGRGVQTALLHRRRRLAALAGRDMVWSRADSFSGSERNMLRAGFSLLRNIALWHVDTP